MTAQLTPVDDVAVDGSPGCTTTSRLARRELGSRSGRARVVGRWSAPRDGARRTSRRSGAAAATRAGHRSSVRAAFRRVRRGAAARAGSGCSWPRPRSSRTARRSRSIVYVPAVYDGAVAWCQLFSEPGSGSDLAGLTTRATRDGDHWMISGQKVWSSMAMEADFGMLLARTDFDVAEARGHLVVRVRARPARASRSGPLREITGHALFNEVFFDDAIVDDADLIGGAEQRLGGHATRRCMFERTGHRRRRHHGRLPAARAQGRVPRPAGGRRRARRQPPESSGKVLTARTSCSSWRGTAAAIDDPLVRQKLARLVEYVRSGEWTAKRAGRELARGARRRARRTSASSPRPAIAKLSAEIACDILGPGGAAVGPRRPVGRPLRRGARVLGRVVDLRRHRPDPAQRHRRAGARPPARTRSEQGPPVP